MPTQPDTSPPRWGAEEQNEHLWRPGLRACITELRSVAAASNGAVHDYYTSLLRVAEAVHGVPHGDLAP